MDLDHDPGFVQLLTPDGRRVSHPDFGYAGDDSSIAAHLRAMVLARRLDAEATALQRKGELGLWPPMLGQEAAQVGSVAAVGSRDEVIPSYREHAVALGMGVTPLEILKTFRGTHMVDWDSRALRFHLYSFVIGTQALHATGIAMALQLDGRVGPDDATNAAAMVYFGDGATSQGDVSEAFVFAASYNAPLVLFCQNNQWAISVPIERQTKIPLYQRARGFGIPSVRVDGNDVLAVQAVTSWALDRARRGEGPTFIEAFTYRMGAHTTSDDPTKYRGRDEEASWRAKDPIARVRAYLRSTGAIDDLWEGHLTNESDALAEQLRDDVVSLPDPALADWFTRVYAKTPSGLIRQRDAHEAYEASFEETA
ncbi:pyruvate dehydrogenase (acetyl-transferring) E1 component subunit alpha [Propioniciclava tarda]|uniref:Pyruvate dehydrogenase (Acetyl-transferring) E1 component subunit alpha n=1 Tax=Propioniciclava tarda TaxID=433330 RepID=A0A4V2JTE8_PROTD|nr:pyruvate dehydrogenase (acetyl-transferring) E1 component subunit alpha [Propioniciclava tarda]TBT96041.1 pyruvate dehydrogenase (acetyl-transferring) E1 component subunit alpha [Propioniciclava tarda]SMO43524.1 pyruvate dehydrogenase E1 component alpha subunit [Propioniciclava tarda]